MRVKSPFSQRALFGFTGVFINVTLSLALRGRNEIGEQSPRRLGDGALRIANFGEWL
jgi:hypothetical protein